MKLFPSSAALLFLSGCHGTAPAPTPESLHATAAEWRPFANESTAPLMQEREVAAELARRTYRPEPCSEAAGKPGNKPAEASTAACYVRDGRWALFLDFDGSRPNRTLTWMYLYDRRSVSAAKDVNLAQSRRFAEALTRRFGPADEIAHAGFTHYYWYVPRGIDKRAPGRLHDAVSITILPTPGLNVTLSGWKSPTRGRQ